MTTMVRAPFNRCVECDEIITNPICAECLAERMRLVVEEYNPALAVHIRGIQIDGNTTCISCGKEMGLCAHCFSKEIYEYLSEHSASIAEEFVSKFDFDLRRSIAQ